jgi:ABC-type sugar transport system permease subunit
VYLSALQGLPADVVEAARLDGASRWQIFRHVKFPLLSPTTLFLTVTQIIGAFQSFDLIAMMTGGGPAGSSTTLSWFIYNEGFRQFKAGTAAAGGMIMFAILMVVTIIQMRFVEKKVHY